MDYFEELRKLISEQFSIPEDTIEEDSLLDEDLSITDLDLEDLITQIQKKFDIVIPAEKIQSFKKLSNEPEGKLTTSRAALVRTETLAKIAKSLSLGKHLVLSKGEEDTGGRENPSILANTFEALVGAIYLDQDIDKVQEFLKKTVLSNWKNLIESAVPDNQSRLQEFVQRKYHVSPIYRLISSWGPDHARQFEIGVLINEKNMGRGTGNNKQSAAQNAARDALTRLASKSL